MESNHQAEIKPESNAEQNQHELQEAPQVVEPQTHEEKGDGDVEMHDEGQVAPTSDVQNGKAEQWPLETLLAADEQHPIGHPEDSKLSEPLQPAESTTPPFWRNHHPLQLGHVEDDAAPDMISPNHQQQQSFERSGEPYFNSANENEFEISNGEGHEEDEEHEEEGARHHHHRFYPTAADHDINDLSAHENEAVQGSRGEDMLAELGIQSSNASENGGALVSQIRWRAKLYQLNGKGSWDDYGTGEFQIVKEDATGEYYLLLISEDDMQRLLHTRITASASFFRQRDTIITWMDDDSQIDFALSFQESRGAQETWETICNIQGKDHMNDGGYGTATEGGMNNDQDEELQMPTLANLQTIVDELSAASGDIQRKRRACSIIYKDNYQFIKHLKEIFATSEDLENHENLFALFYIYKYMFSLGDNKLIEHLLQEENYLSTFGALEYDPDLYNGGSPTAGQGRKQEGGAGSMDEVKGTDNAEGGQNISMRHRDFLMNQVRFKTIVEIDNQKIRESIHVLYRLNYLKDTAIARFVDDQVLQSINNLVYLNSQEIVNFIFQDKEILDELLHKMRGEANMQDKHDAIEFFMEVCQMTKNMQMGARYSVLETINSLSLIEILAETMNLYYPNETTLKFEAHNQMTGLVEYLLQSHDTATTTQPLDKIKEGLVDFLLPHEMYDIRKIDLLKINAIEILMNITQQFSSTSSIRTFALCEDQKSKGYPFIKRLAFHLLYSYEQGVKIQVFEFFKVLLDNEQAEKKVEFNDLFYKEVLALFLNFLSTVENEMLLLHSSEEKAPTEEGAPHPVALEDSKSSSPSTDLHTIHYNKSLEYSRSLVVQLITKCAQEHAFRFRIFAVQQEVIERVSRLRRFESKLLNLWIVKFYKAIIKVKDEAFVMYLIKKNLLDTIVQIFIENTNKGNLLHSAVLELFDYLTRDVNKKIANNFLSCYSEQLFQNPEYSKYFKNFVDFYEGKPTSVVQPISSMISGAPNLRPSISNHLDKSIKEDDYDPDMGTRMKKSLLPQKRFDQEDSDSDSDRIEENDDEENERFNQEMFKKRKAEQDKDHSILAHLMQRRKSSSGGESSGSDDDMNDEEDRIFDMGVKVFDRRPMQSMLEKRARQQSPGQGEEKPVLYFNSNTKRISPSHSSSSSNGSPKVRTGAQPASNRMIQFVLESETKDHKEPPLLFTSDDFVEGGTLINPVTGEQKEPKQKEDDLSAFELLESQSVSGKRVKTESNGNSDEPQPSENKPESTEIKEAHKEQEENHIEQKGGNE